MNFEVLKKELKGLALTESDDQYEVYTKAWNLAARQQPLIVIVAQCKDDIIAAVKFADASNLGVGVMATGHGVGTRCNGGILINTSQMRGVKIDVSTQTATVEAGAQWKDVVAIAHEHGLAALAGSASHVGVVGYTMGGGFGYLGRKFGLNSSSVISMSVITADGTLVHASKDDNADLFWAIKGGGGNFGIVTSLEFQLYPLTNVFGGAVYYPSEHSREILTYYSQWTKTIPHEISIAIAFMNVPDMPAAPPPLRGRSVVAIKGCYCGDNTEAGEKLFHPIRTLFKPLVDTFTNMSVKDMDQISKDPVDPLAVLQYGVLLQDLNSETIDSILRMAGPGSMSPLTIVELRKLGGALNTETSDIRLLGSSDAQFSLNALGAVFNPTMEGAVSTYLKLFEQVLRPHSTDEVFLNFMEVDPTPERVRAAYTRQDWKKLTQLKNRFDPKNAFRYNRNIPAAGSI